MSKNLFESDESDKEVGFKTNDSYAKSYNKFRQKELLKKFKDQEQNHSDSNSSSDSSSSDEDDLNDPKFDQEFFKTLASIKSRNPTIYDKNTQFFDEFQSNENGESSKKKHASSSKPLTIKDYERKIMLENEGKFEDDSDNENREKVHTPVSPSFIEQERALKEEFKKVIEEDNEENREDFGGIFKKRTKTEKEEEIEKEDFAKWLANEKEDIEENAKTFLEPLKKYWSNTELPKSEVFLRDYILNKGYSEANCEDVPTYDEIVGDDQLSEDEKELEKQDEFEQNYNFRFQEPDSEMLKRYPRTVLNSVRLQDDKRKRKRNEIKERKQQEKERKMKEYEIIKEMKRKEIEDKIRKLKEVTGNEEIDFKESELEEDFDPEEHDRRMKELFNEEYYQVDEGEEKPACPSDIEELKIEDWDNYDPNQDISDREDYEPHCEDDDFNMDCDYDPRTAKEALQQELIENTRKRKGRKNRRNRFREMIKSEKPVFNPDDEKTYAEYIEEYYKLDCEDIIDDIPCRFKYVETTPNDFGLTIEEILLAKNKELNQWASLKKAVQLRPEHLEKKDQRLYKSRATNENLKRKILKSLYEEGSDEENKSEDQDQQEKSEGSNQKKKLKRKFENISKEQETPTNNISTATNFCEVPSKPDVQEQDQNTAQELNENPKKTKKNKNKKKKLIETTIDKSPVKKTEENETSVKKTNPFNKLNKNRKFSGPFALKKKLGSKHKDNKFSNKKGINDEPKVSDERLKAYGINPKKFHKKQKNANKSKKQ